MAGTRGETAALKNKQDMGEFSPVKDLVYGLINALFPTGGGGGESSQAMTLQGAGGGAALAKGNKGEALPGGPALGKGANLNYVFGDAFPDRPAFTTAPPVPVPEPAPVERMSDANPITQPQVPARAPGFAPPMPAPNMQPGFREFAQDLNTMQNTIGPGMPPLSGSIGGFNGQPFEDPAQLLAQALQPVPMPEKAPDDSGQFQDLMRQLLLSGGR